MRKQICRALFRGYKLLVAPSLGERCRFYPPCSDYAYEAVVRHGWWSGLWLAVRRLGKCHPWSEGGFDEVPPLVQSNVRVK